MAEKKKGLFSKKPSAPAEMKPTPRKQLPGYLADALINARNFADRARVPESVPLIGGQGLGSMFLGQAPEEINELSYGNSPIQMNPYAGRTASFVPEMKRGRGQQLADALSLLSLPGARTVAGGLFGGGLTPGVDAAATVYHGSPYRFDRFDSSKIGTGEGAQAYGHGLYLADSPAVAGGYAKNLGTASANAAVRGIAQKGSEYRNIQAALLRQDRELRAQFKDLISKDDLSAAEVVLVDKDKFPASVVQKVQQLQDAEDAAYRQMSEGNLYKVDLPDEAIARMLDWDKPLSQQAPEVQAVLDRMGLGAKETGQAAYKAAAGFDSMANVARVTLSGGRDPELALRMAFPKITDSELKTAIARAKSAGGDSIASSMFRDAGIPGIRYLDGGSRTAGQGTSNYVVFPGNESLLTILERNGQVVAPSYRDPFGNTIDETIR